jgi:hypothetical protein
MQSTWMLTDAFSFINTTHDSFSHPRYMSLNVVDAVASIPNMCEMFHVPFQSGDDDVLREMGRCVLRRVCFWMGIAHGWMDGWMDRRHTRGAATTIRFTLYTTTPQRYTRNTIPNAQRTTHTSGYTVAKYMEIVDRIRALLPDAAVTADVIVGFPGETDEQFENTLKLMEAVKFDQLNTAAYR